MRIVDLFCRMAAPFQSSRLTFGPFEVNVRDGELLKGGLRLRLSGQPFQILLILLTHPGEVVTREQLRDQVWGEQTFVDFEHGLNAAINKIRRTLSESAERPRYIETVPGRGYRFIGVVAPVLDPVEPAVVLRRSRSPYLVPILASVALALVAAGNWWGRRPGPEKPARVTELRQVTSSAAADLGPCFSPDGSQIAFSSDRTGHSEIYIRSLAAGSLERQVTSDGADNVDPAWSPDGQELAYVSKANSGIAVIPVSGGSSRRLTDSGYTPQWSPDGLTLVYVTADGLRLVTRDGILREPLTHWRSPPGDQKSPKWLPDGHHVVFTSAAPSKAEPWMVDTVTRKFQRIPIAADSVLFPSFSADGRFLYYVTAQEQGAAPVSDPVGVWRARIDSEGRPQKPELLIPSAGVNPRDLAVSRDGSWIAVSQVRRESSLWTVPLDGSGLPAGEPKPLIRDSSVRISEPAFSADGSMLAYASVQQGSDWTVYIAKPDGSSSHPVTPSGQSSQFASWFGNESFGYLAQRNGKKEYWISPVHGPPKVLDVQLELGPFTVAAVSRQGTALAIHAGNSSVGVHLKLVDLRTGASRDLTPPGRWIIFPAWSPDGRWVSAAEGLPDSATRVVINVETGAIQTVVTGVPPSSPFYPSDWAPDNDRIVFTNVHAGISNIYWVSRSTGRVQQVTHFDSASRFVSNPAWSPQDNQIVFEHQDAAANIYVAQLR